MDPAPESTSIMTALISLIPVLGGAAIGVLGGLVGTSYAHRLSREQSDAKEAKEKLERLVTEAYEIDIWLKKQESYFLFGGEEPLEQSPIAKIEAISTLYFPELSVHSARLSLKYSDYRYWLIEGAKLRAAAAIPVAPEEHIAKVSEYYGPVMEAKRSIVEEAEKLSKKIRDS